MAEYLVDHQDRLNVRQAIKAFTDYVLPDNATAQHRRVCDYFALVAVAGEIATEQELTGWNKNEALEACKRLFLEWLDGFGHGNKETSNIINHVKGFIEAHGSSRFNHISGNDLAARDRVGFWRDSGNNREYLALPVMFKKELCSGYDSKTVTKTLIDSGILHPAKDKDAQLIRIAALGGKAIRVYVLRLDDD